MKDVQNAIYSIVETRGKECYCILCHAIDVAIEHQPTMPKMHDNLQRGSYPNGKENEWSCFAGIEPRSQGYLAEWSQTGAAGLLD